MVVACEGYAAPMGLGNFIKTVFYKDSAPMELWQRLTRENKSICGSPTVSVLIMTISKQKPG